MVTTRSTSARDDSGAVAARLQDLLDGLVARRDVAHAVLHVESGDGTFTWSRAAGPAAEGGAAMTPETPYLIASVTKLYTAAIVLRLVEDGKVRLDEPVVTYLPEEYATGLHVRGGVDATGRITVRNLLAHSSGLPNYFEDARRGEKSLSARLFVEGDRDFGDADALRRTKELPAHFEPQPPSARRIRYSDTNYWLLGVLIERILGVPVERAFEDLLLAPLGLRRTWLFGRSEPAEPLPEPATLRVGAGAMDFPKFMRSHAADGGLVSTVGDTVAFLRALVHGRVFREAATYDAMLERLHRFGFPTDPAAVRAPSWPIECGLGVFRFRIPRALNGFWSMPAVLGHTGSTGSWLFYCPEWDVYLAGTVDQVTAGAVPYRLVPRILRAIEPVVGRPRA